MLYKITQNKVLSKPKNNLDTHNTKIRSVNYNEYWIIEIMHEKSLWRYNVPVLQNISIWSHFERFDFASTLAKIDSFFNMSKEVKLQYQQLWKKMFMISQNQRFKIPQIWVSVCKFTNERYHLHQKGGHNPINVTHDANM